MKKLAAVLMTAAAAAVVPVAIAPVAQADICAAHTDAMSEWVAAPTSPVTWRRRGDRGGHRPVRSRRDTVLHGQRVCLTTHLLATPAD